MHAVCFVRVKYNNIKKINPVIDPIDVTASFINKSIFFNSLSFYQNSKLKKENNIIDKIKTKFRKL